MRQPKLFLFDEPLSNLDAALRMNTRIEISNLHRALGATIIYVTHDQTEAMTLADKIVVLRDGRVEQVGSPMELYNNPANQFVAGFLGAPSMNFLPASLVGGAEGLTVGVRPEDLLRDPAGPLEAKVTHVEHLGGDTNVVLRAAGGTDLTLRLFGQHEIGFGEMLRLGFRRKRPSTSMPRGGASPPEPASGYGPSAFAFDHERMGSGPAGALTARRSSDGDRPNSARKARVMAEAFW